jgi:hypothetical protein
MFGGVRSSVTQIIHDDAICRIPDFKNLCVLFDEGGREGGRKEGYHKQQPILGELSGHDMDVGWLQCNYIAFLSSLGLSSQCYFFTEQRMVYRSARL